jgi:hypothetical protein
MTRKTDVSQLAGSTGFLDRFHGSLVRIKDAFRISLILNGVKLEQIDVIAS